MDDKSLIADLLHAHGLKKTPIRVEMLELFIKADFALSASDLLANMTTGRDRVTVYRALTSFEEHGILHKASEDGQGTRYALCSHSCPDKSHSEKHAHFVCDECHHTYCLEDVEIPTIKVSDEFSVLRATYTLSGVCKECRI